ncbi:cyclin-dependent kinase 7-like [Drosophila tropicalis]|uniref:cyclin-dependent kinase 7-like n=1 Tax=Drosophila tropicalis TaxID=46794 RepID=UPI0035AC2381
MNTYSSNNQRYSKISVLGEGSFAVVYKARDLVTRRIVAVKKIKRRSDEEASKIATLLEVKILQELKHENIISLIDIFREISNVSLVFELMDSDLSMIIKNPTIILSAANIKAYASMILRGLDYLHQNWILHRDLKPKNLLLNVKGILKICDFGLATKFRFGIHSNVHYVVSRWYRSPELLFGARDYGIGIDMWALGCILAELLLRAPFLPGSSELNQLKCIFKTLGSPSAADWPHINHLKNYDEFRNFPGTPLRDIFSDAGSDMIKLIRRLLAMNPLKRCSCREALEMTYFSNQPAPSVELNLPLPSFPSENKENIPPETGNGDKPPIKKRKGRRTHEKNGNGSPKKRLLL